ncbi:Intraflagellar transport protein 52 [Coelomomyces lativittatus]|nr:Intraflagellar transport protein 52 [Coelomomyces lativittatus]KAJ1512414.1 Intraflagellar transport protein 52 [Coelomomyces lativittatus]KAJ1515606.1 Intraflagellar transport protein 52 [Coelomomyces lativittatus]
MLSSQRQGGSKSLAYTPQSNATLSTSLSTRTVPTKTQPTIIFDIYKRESHTPTQNLKLLNRKLRTNFKIIINKDEISLNRIFEASAIIFCGPREKFTSSEFAALKSYMEIGGSILYMIGEGGEATSGSNFNYLLEEFGISVNSDSVIRTSYFKYFHPKEVYVTNGILNREFNKTASTSHSTSYMSKPTQPSDGLSFVFPFGATLNVQKPSISILSSGTMSYPLNRPVAALYSHPNGKGRLAVIGSIEMFADNYLEKEDNSKLMQVFLDWLTSDRVHLNSIDANEPEVADYHYVPDITQLAQHVRTCLQDSEEVPRDFTQLFDHKLLHFDLRLVPEAIQLYTALRHQHQPLSLIQPQFELPLPPLQPAVFPPILREIPPPPIELFDLDTHFASSTTQLAQLTSKCDDQDLEYYLHQCAELFMFPDSTSPSAILDHLFQSIVRWKKVNQAL